MTAYQQSPFLGIPLHYRLFLVVYFFAYEWFFPIVAAIESPDAQELLVPRVLLRLLYVYLLCLPLIHYRRNYGFLHPLILPLIFVTLKKIAKYPLALLMPIEMPMFSFDISSYSQAFSFYGLGLNELAMERLWYQVMGILAIIFYYLGYFCFSKSRSGLYKLEFHPPRNLVPVCFAVTLACVGITALFIEVYGGGLANHLITMRSGRAEQFQGLGQFLVVASFAILPVLVWFMYKNNALGNPLWIIALVSALLAALFASGARSDLIYPLAILMFLWWQKSRKILFWPSLIVVVISLVVIGAFGAIRQDNSSQSIDTSVLRLDALMENITRAQSEFDTRRDQETDLVAFVGVEEEMLWGRTYIGALAFFVPRAVWANKPRSADSYNMWINFAGGSLQNMGQGRTWGMPVTAMTEAYWNFHIPGVIVLFLLLGRLHRFLARLVINNEHHPAVLLAVVWVIVNFTGTSLTFVTTARDLVLLGGLYWMLGILKIRWTLIWARQTRRIKTSYNA